MGRTLQEILEMQFRLQYYLHMSISDFNNTDLRDLDWLHDRLLKQKKDENETDNIN